MKIKAVVTAILGSESKVQTGVELKDRLEQIFNSSFKTLGVYQWEVAPMSLDPIVVHLCFSKADIIKLKMSGLYKKILVAANRMLPEPIEAYISVTK